MTVFTPTYNRAYILPKLYDSLCQQTVKSFEWLIVDDGSVDNTQELVEKWIEEKKIEIRYFKQENGGKQRAHFPCLPGGRGTGHRGHGPQGRQQCGGCRL